MNRFNRAWPLAFALMFPPAQVFAQPSDAIQPASIIAARSQADCIEFTVQSPGFEPGNDRLLIADDRAPLGWADSMRPTDASSHFVATICAPPVESLVNATALRGWRVRGSLAGTLARSWPVGAPLLAAIESVGPGGQTVWISAGAGAGIRPGQSWWRRVSGQPVLRFDVRFVSPDVCYCRTVPLAVGVVPRLGEAVALWPAPGDEREGRFASAVSLVDSKESDPLVWIAMPNRSPCPREPRFDFFRDGRYIGHGVAERSSSTFWFARVLAPACNGPIQVGDDAVPRTLVDSAEVRVTARVFAQSAEGWLATAGETDGVKPFQTATLLRDGVVLGLVEVRRVQSAYCTLSGLLPPATGSSPSAPPAADGSNALRLLDEVRFGRPSAARLRVGVVENVRSGGVFVAELTTPAPPIGAALAIEQGGATIGAAVLVHANAGRAFGFAIPESLVRPIAAGCELSTSASVAPPR